MKGIDAGSCKDIAQLTPFLCSDGAGFITGGNICADGGMTKRMICHGEQGRNDAPEGEARI